MECFIELWSAKELWLSLSREERSAYLAKIGPHLQSLLEQGVEIIGWGEIEKDTSHKANFDYFAVWKFPTIEMKKEFEAVVMEAEWYNYFHQENASGQLTKPEVIINKLLNL